MKNTMTKKAIELIQKRAHRFNWYSDRIVNGEASKLDEEVRFSEHDELVAIFEVLKCLGLEVDIKEQFVEGSYINKIVEIKVDKKVIFTA